MDWGGAQNANARTAGRPNSGVGRTEESNNGCSDGGGEMGDAGIVADEDTSAGQPFRKLKEVFDADRVGEGFLGTGTPGDVLQVSGEFAEVGERPAFSEVGGKGMDDGKIFAKGGDREGGKGHGSADLRAIERSSMRAACGRQGVVEDKRQIAHSGAKVWTLRAIPGMDLIELAECFDDVRGGQDAEAIESGSADGANTIAEAS